MAKRKTGSRVPDKRMHTTAATPDLPPPEALATLVTAYQQGRYEDVVKGAGRFTRRWRRHREQLQPLIEALGPMASDDIAAAS